MIAKGIEKGIRPLAVPPAKGLFLSAYFPLTSSKMPSRIHLKLSHKTKIKKGEQKTPEWVQCENYFGGYDYENV